MKPNRRFFILWEDGTWIDAYAYIPNGMSPGIFFGNLSRQDRFRKAVALIDQDVPTADDLFSVSVVYTIDGHFYRNANDS